MLILLLTISLYIAQIAPGEVGCRPDNLQGQATLVAETTLGQNPSVKPTKRTYKGQAEVPDFGLFNYSADRPYRIWGGNWPSGFLIR